MSQPDATRRPRVVVPFWAVIAVVVAIVAVVIVVNVVQSTPSGSQSAQCKAFGAVTVDFAKQVSDTRAGTSTADEFDAAVKALPGKITTASSGTSGDVGTQMTASAAAARFYIGHRSDFSATTKVFDSFTMVQHACEVSGTSITIG